MERKLQHFKYYLSLLQMAVAHAEHPEQPADSLRREREASNIDNRFLDDMVTGSRREDGRYRLPGCAAVLEQIVRDLRTMAAPALAENADVGLRLERLLARLPQPREDLIGGGTVEELTRAGPGEEDTLHQFVMDLHKTLNAMQAAFAEERLDGAAVYHIDDRDRPAIAAFMAGLKRTAPLKFNHPGLGTTATRARDELIENVGVSLKLLRESGV